MSNNSLDAQDRIPFAPIGSLIRGIRTDGLERTHPGLYIGGSIHPEDTRSDPKPVSDFLLKKLTESDAATRTWRIAELSGFLRGTTVVDLGAGKTNNGYRIAQLCGANAYVAVEANHFQELYHVLAGGRAPTGAGHSRALPTCVVGEDMRDFVKRLPDNSVSVFGLGIDGYILDNYAKTPVDGVPDLVSHIRRIIRPGSAYLGTGTSLGVSGLRAIDRRDSPTDLSPYIIRAKEATE